MDEIPDEWLRFRTAWELKKEQEQSRKSVGCESIPMDYIPKTESHGSPDTDRENVPTDANVRSGLTTITMSILRESKVPFKSLPLSRTSASTDRIRPMYSVRSWYCVVCGAENPNVVRKDGRTVLCLSCGSNPAIALSEKARIIFGNGTNGE